MTLRRLWRDRTEKKLDGIKNSQGVVSTGIGGEEGR